MKNSDKNTKWIWFSALGAGLLGVLCCVGPIIPVLLGIGGASVLLGLDQFKPVFIVMGLIVLAGTSWYAVRHRRQCCATRNRTREIQLVSLIFGIGILSYTVLQYGVIPALSQTASQKISAETQAKTSSQLATLESISMKIEGMTCAGCAVGVQKVLVDSPGIVAAKVDWKTGKANIQYQPDKTSPNEIGSIKLLPPFKIHELKENRMLEE